MLCCSADIFFCMHTTPQITSWNLLLQAPEMAAPLMKRCEADPRVKWLLFHPGQFKPLENHQLYGVSGLVFTTVFSFTYSSPSELLVQSDGACLKCLSQQQSIAGAQALTSSVPKIWLHRDNGEWWTNMLNPSVAACRWMPPRWRWRWWWWGCIDWFTAPEAFASKGRELVKSLCWLSELARMLRSICEFTKEPLTREKGQSTNEQKLLEFCHWKF